MVQINFIKASFLDLEINRSQPGQITNLLIICYGVSVIIRIVITITLITVML